MWHALPLQPLVEALRDVELGHQVIHAEVNAAVYDFSPSRVGKHARNFPQVWKGKLICNDFGGYKASFELCVTEIGCMAHARLRGCAAQILRAAKRKQ